METSLIEMSREEAKEKLKSYRKALGRMTAKRISAEVKAQYEAVIDGYKALAKGTPVLDLETVMRECGFDEKGRPKLAICRADRKQVHFLWDDANTAIFAPHPNLYTKTQRQVNVSVDRPASAFQQQSKDGWRYYHRGWAVVPMVPADARPKTGAEPDWYILWEVEKWADQRIGAKPDRDPYLLKHIGGSLYAVLAEWDLTELERSIMRQIQL